MDEFEKRLKRDADAIEADVSDELRKRIDASLAGVEPLRPANSAQSKSRSVGGLWWASSITGLAAAIIVIAMINWNRPVSDVPPMEPVATSTVPRHIETLLSAPQLDLRNADFTSPLEDELVKLRADLEKARNTVARDLDFTF